MRTAHGFTLIQLLIAICVLAILLAITIDGVISLRASVAAAGARGALQNALLTGLRTSLVHDSEVVVCPSAGGDRCAESTQWSRGWLVFVDRDGDRRPNADGQGIVARDTGPGPDVSITTTTGRRHVVLQPRGGGAAGYNVTFTICDLRGPSQAATLVVANSGNVRSGRPSTGATFDCP